MVIPHPLSSGIPHNIVAYICMRPLYNHVRFNSYFLLEQCKIQNFKNNFIRRHRNGYARELKVPRLGRFVKLSSSDDSQNAIVDCIKDMGNYCLFYNYISKEIYCSIFNIISFTLRKYSGGVMRTGGGLFAPTPWTHFPMGKKWGQRGLFQKIIFYKKMN